MLEKSPFTFWDFLQQRKRWLQGIYLTVHAKQIPAKNKVCVLYFRKHKKYCFVYFSQNSLTHKSFDYRMGLWTHQEAGVLHLFCRLDSKER